LWKRHHTNPVGTEWKWKMDDPQTILDGALANHLNLIRQFRGTSIFPKFVYELPMVTGLALQCVVIIYL